MKLTHKQIESFVNTPNQNIKAVLVYGPDEGLARERVNKLARWIVEDVNDPFNVVDLNGDQIIENPSLLIDEIFSISMMGGRRLIRIRNNNEKIAPVLKDIFADLKKMEHFILIQDGNLGPNSALRTLFEKTKDHVVALPCYVEDQGSLAKFLGKFFIDHQRKINPDALQLAASILSGDRALARQEANKILIYKDNDPTPISIEDIRACLGLSHAETLDALSIQIADGNIQDVENTLNFLLSEGTAPILILRVVQNYFKRLYITQGQQKNMPLEEALNKLKPPLFWKVKNSFKKHLQQWPSIKLKKAMHALYDAEKTIKSGRNDTALTCNRVLLLLSRMAQSR